MKLVSPAKMMALYAAINIALLTVGIARPGLTGGCAILLTSFFMSIMFPTIFALGVKGLGPNTKLGGSMIVVAIVGGAVIPPLMAVIKNVTGSLAMGYILPLAGYGVVALYGVLGPRIAPPAGNTDPEAGLIAAERGYGI
jgi:FHS family L-fucose permease-like MFS transporter